MSCFVRRIPILVLFASLLMGLPARADLVLTTPAGYLPGVPFLVRVEVRNASGTRDWDRWDALATLTVDQPGVLLSTNRVVLRNGLGTALLAISGTSPFNLSATVGSEVASRHIASLSGQPVQSVSGTLTGTSTTWSGVVNVTGDVTVPSGHTLTIASNTTIVVNGVASGTAGISLVVYGSVQSLGTESFPVTITCTNLELNWGQIRHDTSQPSSYRYTFISKAGRVPGEGHTATGPAIRPTNSTLLFDNCVISDLTAAGTAIGKIMMAAGSTLTLNACVLTRARMGPEISSTGLACTNSYIMEMNGPDDADGIYLHSAAGRPLTLSGCVLAHGDDDAIDTLDSDVTVENCILRDWPNPNEDAKGVSAFHGQVVLRRCLIVNCYAGVSAKSSGTMARVRLDHCTIDGIDKGVCASWKANATAGNIEIYMTNSIVRAVDAMYSDFGPEKFVSVTYCLLSEPWPGLGNGTEDPLFVNPSAGDYHLQAGSPAIDAGDPAFPADPNGTQTDIGFYASDAPATGLLCRITSPPDGALIVAPTNLLITATAISSTGSVSKVEFFQDGVKLGEDSASPYSQLWNVAKIGTFVLQAVATDSGGLTSTSAPVAVSVTGGEGPSTNVLISAGSVWKYLDNGSDQGTTWVQSSFSDASWKTGAAKLGYGDGDEATVLDYGPSASAKYVTYYFRQPFALEDPSRVTSLTLNLLRDDGAIVYLNGREVYRVSMPTGAVDYRTYATTAADYGWQLASLALTALQPGTNVVAVEVHQGNASSSDLAFNLELTATLAAPTNARPLVVITAPPDNTTLPAPGSVIVTANALDLDGTVTNVTFYANAVKLGDVSSPPYNFLWNNIPAGNYTLTATARDEFGQTGISPAVALVVSTNTAAPRIAGRWPTPGPVTNLEEVIVEFTKPVAGVDAGDLLINGVPALAVSGADTHYVFTPPPLTPGTVFVTWAPAHGIVDTFTPPRTFDATAPGATWQYQFTDSKPPYVSRLTPAAAATVPVFTNLAVVFNEPVTGVNAADLLVNSVAASAVSGSGTGPYLFSFAQPPAGTVSLAWSVTHGIHDLANNFFSGGTWKLVLDPAKVGIVITEIMYHPASEETREEYIELHNRESWPINLQGWRLGQAVSYTFPAISIPAGGYLVVAADVATFRSKYPGVPNVIGNWAGILSNSREDINLDDAQGNRVDSVTYAEEGDWAVRQRGLTHYGHRGWTWFAEHDGLGKSLELLNAHVDNEAGALWSSSLVAGGTPGSQNSVWTNSLAPVIRKASHSPLVPKSTDPVLISAQVRDEADSRVAVTLAYRVDAAAPPPFATMAMHDDGLNGDAAANDGVYSALLSPLPNSSVVEFYITATDSSGLARAWPAPAIPASDGAGPSGQVANALFQVDDTVYTGAQPLYKIIMREAERAELQAIHDNISNAANSDAAMNATFIAIDGSGTQLRYLTGARNRGHGTRSAKPNNFRVNFRNDDTWKSVTAINLNAQFSWLQVLGAALHLRSGSVGAYSQPVQLRINNTNLAFTGATDRTYGSYAANEVVDADWADRQFPNDGEGNIYRALRDITPPEFDYRTSSAYPTLYGAEEKRSYTNTWFKQSNSSEDDWTDLIAMLRVMGTNGIVPFTEENLRQVVNVEQWLRHLAVMNLLGSSETSLNSGYNDDYLLYRGVDDPRFILMYYDLDQILGFNNSFAANSSLLSATANNGAGQALNRLLRAPEYQSIYYRIYQELINTTFTAANFEPLVDVVLGDFVPEAARNQLKSWMSSRRVYAQSQLPAVTNQFAPVAILTGIPRSPTFRTTATLKVGGVGVVEYSYSVNGGAYSPALPVATPLLLSGLPNGTNRIAVVGKNAAGVYQPTAKATTVSWVVNTAWPAVRLNEIIASRSGGLRDQVELYNEGSAPVNLLGMRLTDDLAQPSRFIFGSTTIAPGNYLLLDSSLLGFSLDAQGEGVYLLDSASQTGALLDFCEYGLQITDLSLGRVGNSGEWQLAIPSFGSTNSLQPLGDPAQVRINEWLASGVSPFPDDFVELYNPGSLPVAMGGCFLTDQPVGAPTQSPIAPLSFIPPQGFLAFTSGNGNQADEINFGLSAEQGEIALLGPDLAVIDHHLYASQQAGVASGRCPDGAQTIKSLQAPTPGGPNQCPFVPAPPQSVTLIEFSNRWKFQFGTNLGTAWRATNYPDSSWSAGPGVLGVETAALPEPLRTSLPLGSPTYYFRTTFQVDPGLSPSSLQLTFLVDDGAAFYLNGQDIGPQYRYYLATNAAYGDYATGTVGDASYQFYSIPATGLRAGSNWFAVEVHQVNQDSTDVVFGMKLEALIVTNSVVQAGVVLNEILANNASFEEVDGSVPDWVELYNPSSNAVDLAGMSLTDAVSNPRRWVFPSGSVLLAQGFLKIQCNPGAPASSSNTGFGLKANGGSLYLLRSSAAGGGVQDSVDYGLQAPDWSIGRVPDGNGTWTLCLPTLGMANFSVPLGDPKRLKINEWMPASASGEDWFEIYNPNAQPVNISRLALSDNVLSPLKHLLPPLSFIGNGLHSFLRLIADGNLELGADHVDLQLDDSGEALVLSTSEGVIIDAISFGPQIPAVSQGRLPDGTGDVLDFAFSASPEASNYLPLPGLVVNEVLSHSDPPLEDAVELYNAGGDAVDLSGWFLSDSGLNLRKYELPANTIIPAQGYLVLYEGQFNSDAANEPFAFNSARGDQVFLSEAVGGVLTGYRAAAGFGPAENGVSFGRVETSQGAHFVALTLHTFGNDHPVTTNDFRRGTGAANTYAKVGPVVISEIMYHPSITNDALEYVELHNLTSEPVALFDPLHPENTWRIRNAVQFDLPPGRSIPAHGTLVVVSFNPDLDVAARALFVSTYGSGATLVGPYTDKLDNGGESIELLKPDPPQPLTGPDPGLVPYILVDRVAYDDVAPWPASADGTGHSLQKIDLALYGDEPMHWTAAAPRPGTVDSDSDGMSDGWETTHALNPNSAADAATDLDTDGFSNVQEYLLGTNPRNSASAMGVWLSPTGEGDLMLQFTATLGRSYVVEASDKPGTGWQAVTTVESSAWNGLLTLPIPSSGSARYFRIRCEL